MQEAVPVPLPVCLLVCDCLMMLYLSCRMSPNRRALFDFALLLSKQLEQQQDQKQKQEEQLQQRQRDKFGAECVDVDTVRFDCSDAQGESDDFVHVSSERFQKLAACALPCKPHMRLLQHS